MRLLLGLAGLVLAAGCGLSEYESKMAAEQDRLRYFDEENKYLEEPIQLPERPGNPKQPPPPVRFRPPKGIPITPEPKMHGAFYPFKPKLPPPDGSGTPPVSPSNFQAVYVAVGVDREPGSIRRDLLQAFPNARPAKRTPGQEVQPFESFYHEMGPANAQVSYHAHVYQDKTYQVGIVFQMEKAKNNMTDAVQAMRYSLKSLAVGDEAARPR